MAEKAPELLPGRPVGKEHVEDLLGPARPPRMPMDLVERRHRTAGGVERGELRQKELICCIFDD